MGNHAQENRANRRSNDHVSTRNAAVVNHYRKDDTGEAPGTEPADEEPLAGAKGEATQRQENRNNAQNSETADRVDDHLPGEGFGYLTDYCSTENNPGQQGERISGTLSCMDEVVFVFPGKDTEQQATHEGRDEPAAVQRLGRSKARHGERNHRDLWIVRVGS